jgi:hypothetical protein
MSLEQNYPNPFNSSTSISYSLKNRGRVKIILFVIIGREVKTLVNEMMEQGTHSSAFSANDLSSGIYFYSMYVDGDLFATKKMILVK